MSKVTTEQRSQEFAVWKTIKVGTGLKTADDFRRALKEGSYRFNDWVSDLLSRPEFVVATVAGEADLVVASNADLGRPNGCTYRETCELALATGVLDLCEPEDGPQLRLQYPDQPCGEWLTMAMKAIRGSNGHLGVFDVGRGDFGQWLFSRGGNPDYFRGGDCQFAFRRRKQPLELKI